MISAVEFFYSKRLFPSSWSSKDWSRVPWEEKAGLFFMGGVDRIDVLDVFYGATAKVVAGDLSNQGAMREIREGLARIGYAAPSAFKGSSKDLLSIYRINTVININCSLAWNQASNQKQVLARRAFPAKRLVRMVVKVSCRDWTARWKAAASGLSGVNVEQMAAALDSPVWPRLSRFGAPHAPYDFDSAMGELALHRTEAESLLGRAEIDRYLAS